MPTLLDLHDHLILAQQVTPSVPGVLPPDKITDPNLTYWFGLLSLLAAAAATVSYVFGLKFPRADAPAAIASATAAKTEAEKPHDPSASMYWDAILTSIFEGIKRVESDIVHLESHTLSIKSEDASLREAVLRAAQEARHGVSRHLQEHIAMQERHHDENTRSISEIARQITSATNHLSNQIGTLSVHMNALAVTLGKIETLAESAARRPSR